MADGIFISILKGVDKLVRELPEDVTSNVNCSFGRGFSWILPLDAMTAILYTMIYIDKDYKKKEVKFIHDYAYDKEKSEIMKKELKLKYESDRYHREDDYGKVGCKYYNHWCIKYYVKVITQDKLTSRANVENFFKTMIELMAIKGVTPCKHKYIYDIGEEFSNTRIVGYEFDKFIECEIRKVIPEYDRYKRLLPIKYWSRIPIVKKFTKIDTYSKLKACVYNCLFVVMLCSNDFL